jgi:mannan endo-1,4-beta-mannosidase
MHEENKVITIIVVCEIVLMGGIYLLVSQGPSTEREVVLKDILYRLDEATNEALDRLESTDATYLVRIESLDGGGHLLVNEFDGYRAPIPTGWMLDDGNFEHATILYDDDLKLSVFRQDIDQSYDTVDRYINYSLVNVRQDYGPVHDHSDEEIIVGSYKVRTTTWTRDPLLPVKEDKDHYFLANVITDERSVFTFLLKSGQDAIGAHARSVEEMIEGMVLTERTGGPEREIPEADVQDILMEGDDLSLTIPRDGMAFGIYYAPDQDYSSELAALEKRADLRFELIMDYFPFREPFSEYRGFIETRYDEGRVMLLTLQPFLEKRADDFKGSVPLLRIVNGEFDQLILEWALGLKDLNEPVFLRFANEMNGDWVEWCSWFYGLDPDIYIYAWARVHAIFQEAGADNVHFVWNPHDRTYPDYDWNCPYLYYPGDDLVDWIGLTAYNNGVTRYNEKWRSFKECYGSLYDEYMERYSSKYFMITEFACNEIGGDKAAWIEDALGSFASDYPNIRMAVWWNGIDETWIYDIDSSESSIEAFRAGISDPYYLKDPVRRRD